MSFGTPAHRAALLADEKWSQELVKIFGKNAGDARYKIEGRGSPGTPLRAAYDARGEAMRVWQAENRKESLNDTV